MTQPVEPEGVEAGPVRRLHARLLTEQTTTARAYRVVAKPAALVAVGEILHRSQGPWRWGAASAFIFSLGYEIVQVRRRRAAEAKSTEQAGDTSLRT